MHQVRTFLLCSLITLALWGPSAVGAQEIFKEGVPPASQSDGNPVSGQFPRFTQLVKELSPAVVNISVEVGADEEIDAEGEGQPANPFFKREPGSPLKSLGSGFIVQEDGYVVTNYHVIGKAKKIVVRLLDDKSEYVAKLIGRDLKTDLALLKIEPGAKLKTVYLGNSDELEVGEWVIAIGNQFQLGHTVSAGIVSALARKVHSVLGSPYESYIQTDASINPGSSGGPLFNTKGQVIGVNTAIYSPGRSALSGSGFNIGIGFAIPINMVKEVVNQLKERGKVTRGLLGVIIQQVDAEIAQILGLPGPDGALVADVMDASPAKAAGFKKKDVIVAFDGKRVKDYDDLPLLVAKTKIGSTVKVDILRAGQPKSLTTSIGELKEGPVKEEEAPLKADALGLVVGDVPEDLARSMALESPAGVIVKMVEPGSSAARAGVERGDMVEEIAGKPIKDAAGYEAALKSMDLSKPSLALVRKKEGTRFVVLKPRPGLERPKS